MRLYTNIGKVPAVLFGPGDGSVAHFRDEFVLIKDVIKACKVYAIAALNFEKEKVRSISLKSALLIPFRTVVLLP